MEVLAKLGVTQGFGVVPRKYSPTATRKPAVPQAGAQTTSGGGRAIISTIN